MAVGTEVRGGVLSRRTLLRLLAGGTAALTAMGSQTSSGQTSSGETFSSETSFGQTGLLARHRRNAQAPLPQPLVYFGTDTAKPGARGIYLARFNPQTGQLTTPALAAESSRVSFLATGFAPSSGSAASRILYACNEGDEHSSALSSFAIDPLSGALRLLGQVSSGGAGPCYVAAHPNGRWAYAANYAGSTVTGFTVRPDGSLAPPGDVIDLRRGTQFGRRGPVAARQDAPHPHSATISPDGRFLVVDDLGSDAIDIFSIDQTDGRLRSVNLVQNRAAGSGPRHVAFHPNGHWVYGIDELSSRIEHYLWSTTRGAGTESGPGAGIGMPAQAVLSDTGNSVSTLPPGFHGSNTAAELALSPEGTFCYASNRGDDSLVVFAVDAATGALRPVQRISCGGRTPRHFTLSSPGDWLLCGNQDSDTVTVFARDPASGLLRGPVQTVPVPAPMMTLLV